MKTSIRAILFDVGGVLLEDFIDTKLADLAAKYNLSVEAVLQRRKIIRQLADAGRISDREFWGRLFDEFGVRLDGQDYEWHHYLKPVPGSLELVGRLKQGGYQLAILSNDSQEMFVIKKEQFGLAELFPDIILSCEHGWIKPQREIFQIALRRLAVEPSAALFIDDRAANIIAARKLGMATILFQNAAQATAELSDAGLILPPDLADHN
jgi:putative hydrolase of the HAD superfamily